MTGDLPEDDLSPRDLAMIAAGKQKAENTLTGRGLLYATAGGALVGALVMRVLATWGVV